LVAGLRSGLWSFLLWESKVLQGAFVHRAEWVWSGAISFTLDIGCDLRI
jgi:hypothetical protein